MTIVCMKHIIHLITRLKKKEKKSIQSIKYHLNPPLNASVEEQVSWIILTLNLLYPSNITCVRELQLAHHRILNSF